MNNNNKLITFDTTLRDGEQAPGATMTVAEKIEVATALDALGIDIIEAGFACSSKDDFDSIVKAGQVVKNSIICSLARTVKSDIESAAEALKNVKRKRIHTFIATSPIHIKHKLRTTEERVLEMIAENVAYARNFCDDVEWSAEDATRSNRDFLYKCIETAIKAGATTINIPDTVGYAMPMEYYNFVKNAIETVPGMDKVIVSTHCHDDLGMATANSLMGVYAGARQVEGTINGMGERAGNAALEEVIMAVNVRKDFFNINTSIDTTQLTDVSRLVSSVSNFHIQTNKAVVGKNAFAHESGIHQDGMLKSPQTYEIMTPASVGAGKTDLVIGKHSGRNAFKNKLTELGIIVTEAKMEEMFAAMKELAGVQKHVSDEDLVGLASKCSCN
ncbi:2-isopropylmalate synthase [Elusimicrobium posterum]|uniref:2-isopropylmalate synthase n=1 Tax=Elusimicrobium posterum TaxID=3116653 RepID=UPI003C776DC8